MKHFAHNTLRSLLAAIGLSLAAVSAYLTAIFLYDYGQSVGYSFAFATSGVLLDMAKTFLPIAAVLAFRNGFKLIGTAAFLLCAFMMFTSYTISVSALDKSGSSVAAQRHQHSIELLESELAKKNQRIERLRAVNYHSKADQLQIEVDQLAEKLTTRLSTEVQAPSDSFNLTSAKILAALIEITASVTLLLVSAIGRPVALSALPSDAPTPQVPDLPQEVPDLPQEVPDLAPDQTPIAEICEDIIEAQEEIAPPAQEVLETEPVVSKPLALAMDLLAGGQARPSQRSLAEAMDIKRPEAEMLLTELESSGFLVKDGRVRVLAS